MAKRDCACYNDIHFQHTLEISFYQRRMDIFFPHRTWAASFKAFLNDNEFHRNLRTEFVTKSNKDDHLLQLWLPDSFQRLSVKYPQDGIKLVFDSDGSAKEWEKNSGGLFCAKLTDPQNQTDELLLRQTWSVEEWKAKFPLEKKKVAKEAHSKGPGGPSFAGSSKPQPASKEKRRVSPAMSSVQRPLSRSGSDNN